jgi:hypothetical protein
VASDKPSAVSRYATSTKNIAGCTLAIGGPVLALLGVVAPPVGLALAPVLYAVGAIAAPGRHKVNIVAGLDQSDVTRSLDQIQRRTSGRVPSDLERQAVAISTAIKEILPRADALGAGSPAQFVLVQCATDYLPSALQAYLDLPRNYAEQQIVADGKTPHTLLSEQLTVLQKQIAEIADAVNRADTDKLVANGRFLAEKFGRGPLDLGGPEERSD